MENPTSERCRITHSHAVTRSTPSHLANRGSSQKSLPVQMECRVGLLIVAEGVP